MPNLAGAMQTLVLPARRLLPADEEWAAALLAEAYATAPETLAGTPALHHRAWLRLLLRYALHAGCVYAGPDDQSVALWLPAEAAALSWGSLLRNGQLALPLHLGWSAFWALMQQQQRLEELRHRALPTAHHQLLALGVRPARQGRGAGRALLRASLAAVGARFLPCYAPAYSPRALALARQQGFEVAAYDELLTPAGRVPCWGLVRGAGAV
jgi:ribosomal protein S18 acetylase RimI-like enzyme